MELYSAYDVWVTPASFSPNMLKFIPILQAAVESMGGSVWQLAAEHINDTAQGSNGTSKNSSRADDGSDEEDEGNSSSDSDRDDEPVNGDQRVALACEDGCVRIFEVGNAHEGMVYRQSLPLVKGRVYSFAKLLHSFPSLCFIFLVQLDTRNIECCNIDISCIMCMVMSVLF